jgi:effector-binding domain-containing protein
MKQAKDGYEMLTKAVPTVKAMTVRSVTSVDCVARDIARKFGELCEHVAAKGAAPVDYFTLYHDETFDPAKMHIEVCVSVSELVEDGPEVRGREIPGGTCASVIYKGPYSGIGDAFAALEAMVGERGLIPCGPKREVYLNDPDEVAPEDLLTEVQFPVRE